MRTHALLTDVYGLEPGAAIVFQTICLATARPVDMVRLGIPSARRTVSRLAIASSTGLPRETVRRKCAELAKAGLIECFGRKGVAVAPGQRLAEQNPIVLRQILADTHQTLEILFRLGVFAPADESRGLIAAG